MSLVFVISAPSGSGKSTLVRRLLERDSNLIFSISYTTREPRGDEKNGREYNFISREEFISMRDRGEFVEWAPVFKDHFYGTHQRYLDQGVAESKDVVLDIDVKGARQLKDRVPGAISIFILAPSRDELEQRLRARGDVTEETIRKRVAEAAREIHNFGQYDHVLVNDDVEVAADLLHSVVKAARIRRRNKEVEARVYQILATFESQ